MQMKTPESLREEHEEIFHELRKLSQLKDETGRSMRELHDVLKPHFEREEELAMPLLGLLLPLSAGKEIEDVEKVLELHGKFRQAYVEMIHEHEQVRGKIAAAKRAAEREGHKDGVELMDALAHHAKIEEEVLYPAALLVGTVLLSAKRG